MKPVESIILCLFLYSCGQATGSKNEDQDISIQEPIATQPLTVEDSQTKLDSSAYDVPIDYDSLNNIKDYLFYDEVDTSELQTIDFDCILFISPSGEQINEMGEGDYRTGVASYKPYLKQQEALSDSMGIRKETARRRYIKFDGEDRFWIFDVRKKNMPEWNLIVFKSNKSPMVPRSDVTIELLEQYFGKEH